MYTLVSFPGEINPWGISSMPSKFRQTGWYREGRKEGRKKERKKGERRKKGKKESKLACENRLSRGFRKADICKRAGTRKQACRHKKVGCQRVTRSKNRLHTGSASLR